MAWAASTDEHRILACLLNRRYGATQMLLRRVSMMPTVASCLRVQEAGVQLPSRFEDADVELMRYAGTAGLLRASPEGRPAVAAKSARAVQATTEWLARYQFLTDSELQRWDDLVRGMSSAAGRPLVVILLHALGRVVGSGGHSRLVTASSCVGAAQRSETLCVFYLAAFFMVYRSHLRGGLQKQQGAAARKHLS